MSFGVYQMYGIIQLLVTIHSINRDNIKYECCLLHICGLSALNAILYMMSEDTLLGPGILCVEDPRARHRAHLLGRKWPDTFMPLRGLLLLGFCSQN